MIRGTTPTHSFAIPLDATLISKVRVTYDQNGKDVLTKDFAGADIIDGRLSFKLTQEETLDFEESGRVSVQVRVLTTGGDALASKVVTVGVKRILDDSGVLE